MPYIKLSLELDMNEVGTPSFTLLARQGIDVTTESTLSTLRRVFYISQGTSTLLLTVHTTKMDTTFSVS